MFGGCWEGCGNGVAGVAGDTGGAELVGVLVHAEWCRFHILGWEVATMNYI